MFTTMTEAPFEGEDEALQVDDLDQFDNGYWYATELKDFAERIGIPSASKLRKDELERAIKAFRETGRIESPTKRSLSTSGVRDVERGLSLDLRVVVYTNDRKTKDFLEREALRLAPGLKRRSGARYRLNRWREDRVANGVKNTYRDLVREYVRLSQTEGTKGCGGHKGMKAIVLPAALALALALPPAGMTAAGAQSQQPNVEELLMRVVERVAEFYKRAENVIFIETSTVQPVDFSNWPAGFVRTVESEAHFEAHSGKAPGEVAIARTVRKVNGRAPREKNNKDRLGCTDPNPLSPEPLAFLLPSHRSEYQFRTTGITKDRNRTAVIIDFASVDRGSNPELIEDPSGHDDCFDWSGHIASKGRIWVDAISYDVLRVERGLGGPVDVRVPELIQRRHHLAGWVVIGRDDVTIRYKTVAFSDPDEVLLLPESIESLTVVRGGLESTRRNQTFSDYKRFVTGGRVLQ
jgi:SAP domain-containing new25